MQRRNAGRNRPPEAGPPSAARPTAGPAPGRSSAAGPGPPPAVSGRRQGQVRKAEVDDRLRHPSVSPTPPPARRENAAIPVSGRCYRRSCRGSFLQDAPLRQKRQPIGVLSASRRSWVTIERSGPDGSRSRAGYRPDGRPWGGRGRWSARRAAEPRAASSESGPG